ncbi:uncharacterized protein LOC107204175 [Parus major]|uniref:uncharacterized protein LOC107204175 n=1 Tax=Parus major TaxID=9157 RepID=UPI00077162E3|nr:uncharacterized protein LOC107204175 [Parus major]
MAPRGGPAPAPLFRSSVPVPGAGGTGRGPGGDRGVATAAPAEPPLRGPLAFVLVLNVFPLVSGSEQSGEPGKCRQPLTPAPRSPARIVAALPGLSQPCPDCRSAPATWQGPPVCRNAPCHMVLGTSGEGEMSPFCPPFPILGAGFRGPGDPGKPHPFPNLWTGFRSSGDPGKPPFPILGTGFRGSGDPGKPPFPILGTEFRGSGGSTQLTWCFSRSYEDFYLSCSLSHGGKELCSPLLTRKAHVYKYLFHLIIWDQQICFPVQVNRLPRETLLSVTLFAVPVPPPGGSSDANKQRRVPEALGWVTTPLFNFRQVLTCGRKLLGLWPATQDNSRARSSAPNFNQPDSVILQIDFPTSAFEVKFTNPPAAEFSPRYEFGSLGEEDQRQLREAMQKKSLYW